jgi:hypothetical protein
MRSARLIVDVYGPVLNKPENRSLIHYQEIKQAYEMAVEALANNVEMIDDSEPRSDICSMCSEIAIPLGMVKFPQTKPVCCNHREVI